MTAIEFYTGLLASNSLEVKEEGRIILAPNSQVPLTIDKKTLMLPTESVLATYNDNRASIQVFHPVSENILRRDSPVFNFLKRLYRNSLSVDFELLSRSLLVFAMDGELSSKASKTKRNYLKGFADLDAKTLENYEAILKRVDPQGEHKLIDFTVSRGGEIDGMKYSRVCHIRLPLLKLLLEHDEKPFGVKLRKKDYENIIRLHEALFGEEVRNLINGDIWKEIGTNNASAPNFICLTEAYAYVKAKLITVSDAFEKTFEPITSNDLSWMAGLNQVDIYRALIPTFEGNDGEPLPQQEERKTLATQEPVKVTPLGTRREIKTQEAEKKAASTEPKLWWEKMDDYSRRTDYGYEDERRDRRRSRDIDLSFVEGKTERDTYDRGYSRDRRRSYDRDDYDGFGYRADRRDRNDDRRGYYRR